MVYIPLIIGCTTHLDKARVHLLGLIMIWTYSPLIPGLLEGVLKNLLFMA